MKKFYSLILCSLLFYSAMAQNSLHTIMLGNNGLSKHYTMLSADEQKPFVEVNLKHLLELNAKSGLSLINADSDNLGYIHYRYNQTYNGYLVENSMLVVNVKSNVIYNLVGSIVLTFDSRIDAQKEVLTKQQAIDAALKFTGASIYAWQDENRENALKKQMKDTKATNYPSAEKVWFNSGDEIDPSKLRLCYKVDVYSLKPFDRKYIFVDAETGNVLGTKAEIETTDATGTANTQYSGSQTIHSDLNSGIYRLHDIVKGNGVITLHGEYGKLGNEYTSTTANWTLNGQDQHAMDVHWGIEQTYTFYKNTFGRNSYNNNNAAIYSYVNDYSLDQNHNPVPEVDNAHWDNNTHDMHFGVRSGSSNGVTGIDVTAHELTHGVTQYTSALGYQGESGAINESMSDIIGKSVQFFAKPTDINWVLSNDMGWLIRSMANPNAYIQPDTYNGTYWYNVNGCTPTQNNDYCGVHTNSGVGNYMYYLLVNGGTGTNDIGHCFSVAGVGLAKAEQILYRSETTYLFATAKYADWRTACINAATDLYGATSNEVIAVTNAWYAVGVGAASSLTITGNNFFCTNGVYSISNLPAGATVTWSATPAGYVNFSCTNCTSTTLTKTAAGSITLNATVTSPCGYLVTPKSITVGAPQISISKQQGSCSSGGTYQTWLLKVDQPSYGTNWNWTDYDPNNHKYIYSPNSSSTYVDLYANGGTVLLTYTDLCGAIQTAPAGIYKYCPPSFTVTPNPSKNYIVISDKSLNNTTTGKIKAIKITDRLGTVRKTYEYKSFLKSVRVTVSDLESGVYLVSIYDGHEWNTQSLIVQ